MHLESVILVILELQICYAIKLHLQLGHQIHLLLAVAVQFVLQPVQMVVLVLLLMFANVVFIKEFYMVALIVKQLHVKKLSQIIPIGQLPQLLLPQLLEHVCLDMLDLLQEYAQVFLVFQHTNQLLVNAFLILLHALL